MTNVLEDSESVEQKAFFDFRILDPYASLSSGQQNTRPKMKIKERDCVKKKQKKNVIFTSSAPNKSVLKKKRKKDHVIFTSLIFPTPGGVSPNG